MSIPVHLERMETRWIAYIAGLPGCFRSSEDRDEALISVPAALRAYRDWCASKGSPLAGPLPEELVEVEEVIDEWVYPTTGEPVNAFFAADVPPLTADELAAAARLLEWTCADLKSAIADLPDEVLDQQVVGAWNIRGIFYHTCRADWWYLHVFGLAPDWEGHAPTDSLPELLDWTQSLFLAALPGLENLTRVDFSDGELWSPRKVLRRGLWHRRDHEAHIYQFRQKLSA